MAISVAVAGASGYAGGEALRLLLDHPNIEVGAVTGHSSAGDRLGDHHPHLLPLADRVLEPTNADSLAGHDVVILALLHGSSDSIGCALYPDMLVLSSCVDFLLITSPVWYRNYDSLNSVSRCYEMTDS